MPLRAIVILSYYGTVTVTVTVIVSITVMLVVEYVGTYNLLIMRESPAENQRWQLSRVIG